MIKNVAEYCTAEAAGLILGENTPSDVREDIEAYFHLFAAPIVRLVDNERTYYCLSCNQPINSFLEILGVAVAHRWDIVYGEAFCSGCHWPSRGIHRITDRNGEHVCTIKNVFLYYHPDVVSREKSTQDHDEI